MVTTQLLGTPNSWGFFCLCVWITDEAIACQHLVSALGDERREVVQFVQPNAWEAFDKENHEMGGLLTKL